MFCTKRYFSFIQDPFKVLGLTRAASKSEIKSRYRQLARLHHPDTNDGKSRKMQQINEAYKTLMKDGGFQRLRAFKNNAQLRNQNSVSGNKAHVKSSQIFYKTSPFSAQHQSSSNTSQSTSSSYDSFTSQIPLSDEQAARLSALDPTTQRRTAHGTFLYQSRDDQSWVQIKKPLYKASQPRYTSFKATLDMAAQLQRRAIQVQQMQLQRTRFERIVNNLVNGGQLPSTKRPIIFMYMSIFLICGYFAYKMQFAGQNDLNQRKQFYQQLNDERNRMLQMMSSDKDSLEAAVAAAAVIYLAACANKTLDDPIQPNSNEVFYHVVRPPPEHFTVLSRV